MRTVAFVLLSWVCGYSHRTQARSERVHGRSQEAQSNVHRLRPLVGLEPLPSRGQARAKGALTLLARLLLARKDTAAGWQVLAHGHHRASNYPEDSCAEILDNEPSSHFRVPFFRSRVRSPSAIVGEQKSIQIRRIIYKALAPLDRGDFRWEFLVPWTNKTLTAADKFIICSAFIGTSFTLQRLADPGASVGVHLSYIAQFFSYVMGDPIGFRLLAVLTSVLEILGNVFEEKSQGLLVSGLATPNLIEALRKTNDEDVFPIFYDEIFIVINSYYILRWFLSREQFAVALDWSEEEEALYTKCFAGLGFRRAQFSRLLRSATFVAAGEEGDTLTVQNRPICDLFVPLNGSVEVRVDGQVATRLSPYQLVGEASLLENLQSEGGTLHPNSRATVVAGPGSAYVRWPQSAFYELQQEEDSDFAYAIQLMIARQLSDKLKEARLSQRQAEATSSENQPASDPGARVEMQALVERGKWYENRISTLEKTLSQSKQELDDLRTAILLFTVAGGLAVAPLLEDARMAMS